MSTGNISTVNTEFILIGFPGLEGYQHWLTIPFSVMYSLAIVGNILLIYIVKLEPNLHSPMYTLLSVLAMVDIGLCTSTIPKMLQIFWQKVTSISFEGCFSQMFFIHVLSSLESSTLAVMAYDRYVAIYNPLLYTTILTTSKIAKILGALFVRCFILAGLVPVLASMLPYCSANAIQHCFCDHMAVAKLACKDITMNSYYGLTAAFVIMGTDVLFILFTYVMILRAVSKLGSKAARLKAFNTCGSHLFVILYFYTTMLFTFVTYRFGKNIPPRIHVMFAVLYLLVPPMLNPIVYGVRTKEIRETVMKEILSPYYKWHQMASANQRLLEELRNSAIKSVKMYKAMLAPPAYTPPPPNPLCLVP
ncbi:olfactory receptor 52E4-like [Polyodon spathula]|uniref:olfactory receptor 52E4-like n=1 Tax=Polyodon spathula TaxID=7913 RepID=UPI001B7DE2D5|nr:olfactory receptor 52E4-like [Polyodon spathula]